MYKVVLTIKSTVEGETKAELFRYVAEALALIEDAVRQYGSCDNIDVDTSEVFDVNLVSTP